MKGTLAWIIFGCAALSCLFWIGFGVRDDLREDDVFHNIIEERLDRAASPEGDIHIGVVGDWKVHKEILNGVELAAKAINAKGGILGHAVVLESENDHGTIEGALATAQSFAARPEIPFVIGHTRTALNASVAQNYEFYGLLTLSPNGSGMGSSANSFSLLFENGMPAVQTGGAILALAKEKGWHRLGLIYAKSGHAMRQARQFESMANKHGIEVPLSFGFEGRGSGISMHMERWKRELNFDAMILTVENADSIGILSACRAVGIECPFVVVAEKPEAATRMQAMLGSVYYLKPIAMAEQFPEFFSNYEKRFKVVPGTDAVLGYDALLLLAQAIEKADSFVPADVAAVFKSGPMGSSVSGTLQFDKHGAAIKRPPSFGLN